MTENERKANYDNKKYILRSLRKFVNGLIIIDRCKKLLVILYFREWRVSFTHNYLIRQPTRVFALSKKYF